MMKVAEQGVATKFWHLVVGAIFSGSNQPDMIFVKSFTLAYLPKKSAKRNIFAMNMPFVACLFKELK